jgi:hypothetical protein
MKPFCDKVLLLSVIGLALPGGAFAQGELAASASVTQTFASVGAEAAVTANRTSDAPFPIGGVLVGPCGLPGAVGPTGVNDDFTNRSIIAGVIDVPHGVTRSPGAIVFRNTVQNIGTDDDTFRINAPSAPPGFTVEISVDDGANFITAQPGNRSVSLPLAYRAAMGLLIRVTAPAGLNVLTGFDTVIRAASTTTPAASNDTIDRLYTGFIRCDQKITVIDPTGDRGPNNAAPGAEIEYAITYSNVSSADGAGSSLLTAHNLVINENGNTAPNHWGATTDHVIGASDTQGGLITGDFAGSISLSDTVTILGPGQSGVFKFRRQIKDVVQGKRGATVGNWQAATIVRQD